MSPNRMIRRFAIGLAAVVAAIGFASACRGVEPSAKPNIILIIADDLGAEDCGPFGNPKVRTPNLDRLAREGMRFDRAFLTCSSCSPSRSSLITSRYPHNTGAEELHLPLPRDQVVFPELLRQAGYWTAAAGKWHLGEPIKARFDAVAEAGTAEFQLPVPNPNANPDPTKTANAQAQAKAGRPRAAAKPDPSGCAQWLPVLRSRPQDRPFFLWLASFDPHRDYQASAIPQPHDPKSAIVPPYLPDHPEVRRDLALYYDEIARLDGYVGQVLDELDRQKIADNTCVLFLSDNGRPFPRCKTTVYDSGIRTPLLVRWPGRIAPGSVCSSLASSIDIAPTLTQIAGAPASPTFQGRSLAPLFADPRATVRDHVFAEHNWHDFAARGRAVRSLRFKYVRNDDADLPNTPPADAVRSPTFQTMRQLRDRKALDPAQMASFVRPKPVEELYDVDRDPHELRNLADDPEHRRTLGELRAVLDAWQAETGDRKPTELSPDEFDRETGAPLPNRQRPRVPKR